jgi:hypothetical protein
MKATTGRFLNLPAGEIFPLEWFDKIPFAMELLASSQIDKSASNCDIRGDISSIYPPGFPTWMPFVALHGGAETRKTYHR